MNDIEILFPDPVPSDLVEAFWAYDRALLGNDQEIMDALFEPGPDTLRTDGRTTLVGYEAIRRFRHGRSQAPTRTVARIHIRITGPDTALIIAETRSKGAEGGTQTQLWRRADGLWRVAAAHVSQAAPAAAFDRRVWRVLGDPLVRATGSGPLAGANVAVKDLFAVAGQPVGAGVPAWLSAAVPEPEHAGVVRLLLAAGADVAGIARTDEFAYSLAGTNAHYGVAPNPAAPGCVPGGSSSGPASAVALGQATVGLGTDTGGSVRVPASYQGLWGIRTTHDAVSRNGLLPLAPSFDTVGWFTRDPRTLAAVAQVLVPAEPQRLVDGTKIRLIPTATGFATPEVAGAFADTVAALAAGVDAEVETVDLPAELLEQWFTSFRTVQGWEAWQQHGEWISDHPGALGPDIAARFAVAATVSAEEVAQARTVVAAARDQLAGWTQDAVIALPSASSTAPPVGASAEEVELTRAGTLRLTCLAGLGGLPAVSVPAMTVGRHPVGLCLLGPRFGDHALISVAADISASLAASSAEPPSNGVAPRRQ